MNHTAIIRSESQRQYDRRSFILGKLDDRHFGALNADEHALGLNGYCLDALDTIPAGGMESDTPNPRNPARGRPRGGRQTHCVRGHTLAELRELEALASRLVAEILAEEAATRASA